MFKISKKIVLILILLISSQLQAAQADLVIFSYDRPMQLYALLESLDLYVRGIATTKVIYRSSDDAYAAAYEQVQQHFPAVQYMKQGKNPTSDFKSLTLQAAFGQGTEHIIFAVDDIIVTDFIDLERDIALLEQVDAYGMYYRLGKHVTYCYPMKSYQGIPAHQHVADDVYAWRFGDGMYDFNYPNTVDMTLYRKRDLDTIFSNFCFVSPNFLEAEWAGRSGAVFHRRGLFHARAKIVNVPLNLVQREFHNPNMNSYSPAKLLELFNQGLKIDIHALYKVDNKSAHMEYEPRFVLRHARGSQEGVAFVVVTASYNNKDWYQRNLDSIFAQTYPNFRVIYVDDLSLDGTGMFVEEYINQHNLHDRITFIKNTTRYGAMENQYRAIHSCADNEVIVILDGDDFFAHPNVLDYLSTVYADPNVWLTYGQFQEYPSGAMGFCCPMPQGVIASNGFRDFAHIPSHLRTYYAGLFKQIKKEDLMYQGEFLKMTCDIAQMFPMIEMARNGHFRFIPHVLCIYNAANVINDYKVSKPLQRTLDLEIRSRARYSPAASYKRGK